MTRRLREVGCEVLDRLPDQLVDRGDNACTHPLIAEGYLEGRLCLHVHLRVRLGDGDLHQLCAVMEATAGCGDPNGVARQGDWLPGVVKHKDCAGKEVSAHVAVHWVDDAVLIGVGQPRKQGEDVVPAPVRSVVGLRALDECPVGVRQLAKPLLNLAWGSFGGCTPDWERDFAIGPFAVEQGELPDEMVQGVPSVLGEVSEDRAEPERGWLSDANTQDVRTYVRVELGHDFIRLGRKEGARLDIEREQVLVCPREFGAGAVQ